MIIITMMIVMIIIIVRPLLPLQLLIMMTMIRTAYVQVRGMLMAEGRQCGQHLNSALPSRGPFRVSGHNGKGPVPTVSDVNNASTLVNSFPCIRTHLCTYTYVYRHLY